MNFEEYKDRVALALNMLGLQPSAAMALVYLRIELVRHAYNRAHAARNVAEALMKMGSY
jgi:hypothetical protein